MLLIGKHVTSAFDPLQPTEVEKVFRAITQPRSDIITLLNRLHAIRMIDAAQYRKMKTELPYIVCADFHPKVRRKENFLSTERFIVDIDHLSAYGMDAPSLKNKLKEDPTVEMMFTSPSGDGIKILFALSDKITDTGYYSLFYKTFCNRFAIKHKLEGAVDTKTSDVARCCFVSYDPDAYFNPKCDKINAGDYYSLEDNFNLDLVKKEIKEYEKEADEKRKEIGITQQNEKESLPDDVLRRIKEKVGVRVKKKAEKYYEQPEELDGLIDEVRTQVVEVGAEVIENTPISYGRKIKIGAGKYWAEINFFYGQRGVSVVPTSKTGSNRELAETLANLLKNHFQNN